MFSQKRILLTGIYCCFLLTNIFSFAIAATAAEKTVATTKGKNAVNAIVEKANQLKEGKQYRESYALVLPLAEKGDPAAMFLLSELLTVYDLSQDLRPDWMQAAKWRQLAVEKKYPAALERLAQFLMSKDLAEISGLKFDVDRGVKLTFEAEKLGNTKAIDSIAWFYSSGTGLPVDKKEALRWYDKYEQVTGKTSEGRQSFIQHDIDTRVGRVVCLADPDFAANMKPILKVKFNGGRSADLQIAGTIVARSDSYDKVSLLIKSINATYNNGESERLTKFTRTDWNETYTLGTETWVSYVSFLSCN